MADNDPYLTNDEVAERFRVSPATVKGWRVDKVGPPYVRLTTGRPGVTRSTSRVLYRRTDLEAWEAALGQHGTDQ